MTHMALQGLEASYHGWSVQEDGVQEGRETLATPCPLLLIHSWKTLMESSWTHLSQAWRALLSSCLLLGHHYGFTARCPALFAPETWESGVTFQGDKC